jgi:hypothetical protein
MKQESVAVADVYARLGRMVEEYGRTTGQSPIEDARSHVRVEVAPC